MNGKLNILFLSHYFPPESNAPAVRTHSMCRRWVRSGHNVTVITCAPNCPAGAVFDGFSNRWRQEEFVDGIRVIRVWTYIAPNKGTTLRILNYLSYMFSATLTGVFVTPPDVIIATSPQFFCGWAGVLLKKLHRRALLLEIRDIWPDSIEAVGAMDSPVLLSPIQYMERRMYAAATHIVTVGEGYRRELIRKNVPPEKISVVTNGVDREVFFPRPGDGRLRAQYGLGDSFVCAYVGTIGMASGLAVVLEAAKILKTRKRRDIKFLLVGDGAVRAELQQQAQTLGLDNIIFTGLVDQQRVAEILAITDTCLVHLKRRELFKTVLPSKIFEAAAMAKPIVLGVEGEAAELVQRIKGGICMEPENPEDLVRIVSRLADEPEMGKALGHAAHLHVTRHFDREELASNYLKIIHQVAGRQSSKPLRVASSGLKKKARTVAG